MKVSPRMLVALPWTWVGPVEKHDRGATWWELRIKEFPEFMVAGERPEVAIAGAGDALEAWLESMVDEPDWPPLPAGLKLKDFRPTEHRFEAVAAA